MEAARGRLHNGRWKTNTHTVPYPVNTTFVIIQIRGLDWVSVLVWMFSNDSTVGFTECTVKFAVFIRTHFIAALAASLAEMKDSGMGCWPNTAALLSEQKGSTHTAKAGVWINGQSWWQHACFIHWFPNHVTHTRIAYGRRKNDQTNRYHSRFLLSTIVLLEGA